MSAQTIIVTGAGRGIGFSIVKQLLCEAPLNSVVVGVDLQVDQLKELQLSAGRKLEVVEGDLTQRSTSEQAIALALSRSGRLDTLILNAGILGPVGPLADAKYEAWKTVFEVNFFALLHTIQLGLPELRRTQGKIIMTSSGVSARPVKSWVPYACAKSAMNYLSGGIVLEEAGKVASVCISPGVVDTAIMEEVRNDHKHNMPEDQYKWTVNLKENGELLPPDKPASAFVKLALHGIPDSVLGQNIKWNDERITA